MKKRNASSLVYLISFFVVFLAFAAFAIDATLVYTARAKLQNATEMAALAGASCFNEQLGTITPAALASLVSSRATSAFNLYKGDGLAPASVVVDVSTSNKQVRVTSTNLCQPTFLAFLGVTGIRINAVAVAKSETMGVTANYAGVNWLTASSAYLSDVISNPIATNYNNTAILKPIGNYPSASLDTATGNPHFEYLAKGDNIPLSLGPGGFITIKLPAPIVNKPGPDLFIKEIGDAVEGYFVYAGMDADPANPYVQEDKIGGGIVWKNISCSGTPEVKDAGGLIGAYDVATPSFGTQSKFYGSGNFDIGAACSGLSMAKYIRIIDDNSETAFVKNSDGSNPTTYYKALLSGEASTATAGADIDYVDVLNHVMLIAPSAWTP